MKLSVGSVVGASILLAACGGGQDPRVPDLEARIASLEGQQKVLGDQLRLAQLRLDLNSNQWESVAFLTPGEKGYSAVKFDLGYLTVALEDIQPYANGSRVKLRFGNLTSATVNGLKAKFEWGAVDASGLPNNAEASSRDISFEESLRAGSWTTVNVVLAGVPPTQFGFLRVRDVGHRGISLSGIR